MVWSCRTWPTFCNWWNNKATFWPRTPTNHLLTEMLWHNLRQTIDDWRPTNMADLKHFCRNSWAKCLKSFVLLSSNWRNDFLSFSHLYWICPTVIPHCKLNLCLISSLLFHCISQHTSLWIVWFIIFFLANKIYWTITIASNISWYCIYSKVGKSLMPDLEMFSAHMTLQNGKKETQINPDLGGKSSIQTF